ncbi:uncharacterized protein BDW70DRAFT_130416 [Aspergillus foveolatus]|uniref:uncharacterized protein n=1 Tax=Aspergillus foveolatus TaxID=210207 RepID=UPI003CCE2DB6
MNDIDAITSPTVFLGPQMLEQMSRGGKHGSIDHVPSMGSVMGPSGRVILRSTRSGTFVNENRLSPQPDTAVHESKNCRIEESCLIHPTSQQNAPQPWAVTWTIGITVVPRQTQSTAALDIGTRHYSSLEPQHPVPLPISSSSAMITLGKSPGNRRENDKARAECR